MGRRFPRHYQLIGPDFHGNSRNDVCRKPQQYICDCRCWSRSNIRELSDSLYSDWPQQPYFYSCGSLLWKKWHAGLWASANDRKNHQCDGMDTSILCSNQLLSIPSRNQCWTWGSWLCLGVLLYALLGDGLPYAIWLLSTVLKCDESVQSNPVCRDKYHISLHLFLLHFNGVVWMWRERYRLGISF